MTIGAHVTLVNRWLEPAEVDGLITPFMVLYLLHDALVKPMPGNIHTPSLAESWTASKDGLTYEFVLRKNAKFHNGDPVTAGGREVQLRPLQGQRREAPQGQGEGGRRSSPPNRVRFVLKEQWPDFMAFYGTSATGAGWIVPKKYVEKVGDEGFKKAPVGAGPFKFAAFNPGVELVLEAFPEYWRKAPQVKKIVMQQHPRREHAGGRAQGRRGRHRLPLRRPDRRRAQEDAGPPLVAPILYGVYWLDFLDQWEPKSPWNDRRVRLAASLAMDRKAINEVEMLGLGRATGSFVPPEFEFALKIDPPAYDVRARQATPRRSGLSERLRRRRSHAAAALHLARRGRGNYLASGRHQDPRADDGARRLHLRLAREEAPRPRSSARPAPPATRPRASSRSSPRAASMRTARRPISKISTSARRRSSTGSSARCCCTSSRRPSPTAC